MPRYLQVNPFIMISSIVNVVKESEDVESYIFGGWIRDKLNNENPKDMDIFISSDKITQKVCDILKITENIKYISKRNNYFDNKFNLTKALFIDNHEQEISIDIISPPSSSVRKPEFCDFTCNNLIMGKDGQIKTRCPPPRSSKYSEIEWTLKCIEDTRNKNLVWMISASLFIWGPIEEKIELNWQLESRLNKMIAKGYTFKESINNFKLWKIYSHKDVPEDTQISDFCSICSDTYESTNERKTILLNCGHDFHYKCIKKWKIGRENNTCPVCRQEIYFKIDKDLP